MKLNILDAANVSQLLISALASSNKKLALEYNNYSLSYSELQTITNKRAQLLTKKHYLNLGDPVGLFCECKFNAIIWIIAILKAGGTCVALDNHWPKSRLFDAIRLTELKLLICDKENINFLGEELTSLLYIDSNVDCFECNDIFSLPAIGKENLAYIVFTSGSTGVPKGVTMSHNALIYYLDWETTGHNKLLDARVLQFFPLSFDISFQEFLTTLVLEGSVIIAPEHIKNDIEAFVKFIDDKKINKLYLPYVFLAQIAEFCQQNNIYPKTLRQVISSGEKLLLTSKIKQLFTNMPHCKLINLYGASEIQVISTYEMPNFPSLWPEIAPIGQQIKHVNIHILDENKNAVNNNDVGEIYIDSSCLTSGYITTDSSAKEKFITLKINSVSKRVYNTGDLARLLPDGNIEYVGRNDFQVKIRGYRVELGEIDRTMANHPLVQQSVTLAVDDDQEHKKLISYIVPSGNLNNRNKPSLLLDSPDKIEFKLAQHSIRKFTESFTPTLTPIVLDENLKKLYFRRKSYRTFQENIIAPEDFNKLLERISKFSVEENTEPKNHISYSYESLNEVLSLFASIRLSEVSLPKYQYPSAGSLYPVQIYLEVGKGVLGIEPGYYYYNPSHHDIHKLHENGDGGIKFYFIGNLSSIEPLYGDLSRKFCFIELGHMLDLIHCQLRNEGLMLSPVEENSQLLFEKLQLEAQNFLLGSYELTSNKNKIIKKDKPEIYFYIKDRISQYKMGWYHYNYDKNQLFYIGNHQPFMLSISAEKNFSIYSQASFSIFFMADENQNDNLKELYINSGMISQRLILQAPDFGIGLCQIGTMDIMGSEVLEKITRGGTFIQAMFGGSIDPDQVLCFGQSEARSVESSLSEELKGYLSTKLPDYMLPTQIAVIEIMPLTPNSKVDRKALSKLKIIQENTYVAPRNELERKVSEIWAHALRLDENKLGIQDDFFKLGGDSIVSIQLVNKLRKDLGINISVKDIFNYKTIKNLFDNMIFIKEKLDTKAQNINNVISQDYLDRIQKNQEVEGVYLANSLQQGFIYHYLKQGHKDDAYIVQSIWEYNMLLNVDVLKEAWIYTQRKFQSLRLRFAWEKELIQVIEKEGLLDWRYIDLSHIKDKIKQQELHFEQIANKDRLEQYHLERSGLFRIYIIKYHDCLYKMLFSHHHAILDGWSNSVLFKYVHDIYLDLLDKKTISCSIDSCYEKAQKYLQQHRLDNYDYWYHYVFQIEEKIDLSGLLLNRNASLSESRYIDQPRENQLIIEGNFFQHLKSFSQTAGLTINSILQYIWHKILHLYGNSRNTVVGTVVSGRNLAIDGIEDSAGLYINTLPLIVDHRKQEKQLIIDSIREIQDDINEMNMRSEVELSKLQKDGRSLFDVLFIYDNYPAPIVEKTQSDRLKVFFRETIEKLDYPLAFIVNDENAKLVCIIKYAGELFNADAIDQLLSTIKILLMQIMEKPYCKTRELSYLTPENYRKIVYDWNVTEKEYPRNKTIQQCFQEQVDKTPNRIAVVYGDIKLTYRELDIKSTKLAYHLQTFKVQRNDLVGIYLERSHFSIIAIMGILKSGGAYAPIDTVYPVDRVNYMLQDSKLNIVLTTNSFAKNLPSGIEVILLDDLNWNGGEGKSSSLMQSCALDPVYSIYTSGSTGMPKASVINHAAFLNMLHWYVNTYGITMVDKVLIISSICFDLTQKNLMGILLSGGQIHLLDSQHYDVIKINDQIATQAITILNCAPSAFYGLLEDLSQIYKLKTLKKIFLGGEPLIIQRVKPIMENNPSVQIINTYGPTECTDITSAYTLNKNDYSNNGPLPLGKPINNVKVYILNQFLQLLPPCAVGELYIGGINVSRGYLQKPGLTAEKFIPNPFQTEEEHLENRNGRLYKTGDLVRWMSDGNIEFIGRVDHQVKLRGFRIELGEIEATVQNIAEIRQSIAMIKENGDHQKKLILYIVIEKSEERELQFEIQSGQLIKKGEQKKQIINFCREICKAKLPDYMHPNHIVVLDHLPLTPNGKIDRKALPDPLETEELEVFDAPLGLLEEQLANVWKEVLKVQKVGRNDNFFSLGGDSIVSIQMVTRARQKGISINVNQVFNSPTIASLIMNFQTENKLIRNEQNWLTGILPWLPIQIWFFENAQNMNHFNQACWMVPKNMIEGQVLNISELKNALEKITSHHDAFKIKFRKIKDKSFEQYYSDNSDIPFEIIHKNDWNEDGLEKVLNEIQSSLNIEKGPLSKVVYFEGKGLFWVIHHLIIDGVSWRILIEDLNFLYEGKELPEKTHSYKAWAEYLSGYNDIGTTVEYYKTNSQIKLPLEQSSQRILYKTIFSKKITKNFIQEAQKAYNTQANDLLLTALVLAFGKYSNYQLCVDLEGHGREPLDSNLDLTRTIGWFTSVFPVHLMLSEPGNLDKCIKEVKEQLRQVPGRGITYGIVRFIKKQIPQLAIDISFNYLGQWDTIDLEGSTFRFSNEKIGHCTLGNSKLFHNLDILGQIRGGVLSFEWESNYKESVVREIANDFKEKLEALIMHCMTDGVYGYTPSDFVVEGVSQQELENILDV